MPFTASEDELLIEYVSEREILWNLANPEYKNVMKKELMWLEIGKTMNKTKAECKQRWKNIRDHFKKQRKGSTGSAAGKIRAPYWERLTCLDTTQDERETARNLDGSEPYSEETPSVDDANRDNDSCNDPTCSPSTSVVASAPPSTEVCATNNGRTSQIGAVQRPIGKSQRTKMRRRAIIELIKARREDREQFSQLLQTVNSPHEMEDENDLFFKSISLTVKRMPKDLANELKTKIFGLVMEYESMGRNVSRLLNLESTSSSCPSPSPTPTMGQQHSCELGLSNNVINAALLSLVDDI